MDEGMESAVRLSVDELFSGTSAEGKLHKDGYNQCQGRCLGLCQN